MKIYESVAILGAGGSFGRDVAPMMIPPDRYVMGYDINPEATYARGVRHVSLDEALDADLIILSVPIESYPVILPLVAETPSKTGVFEIGSAKIAAHEAFDEYDLSDRPDFALTHPLYGPIAVRNRLGLQGQYLAVTKQQGQRTGSILRYLDKDQKVNVMRNLKRKKLTPEMHDEEMAPMALEMFMGRTLLGYLPGFNPPDAFKTVSVKTLIDVMDIEYSHSEGLYRTNVLYNPYAPDLIAGFIEHVMAQFDGLMQHRQIASRGETLAETERLADRIHGMLHTDEDEPESRREAAIIIANSLFTRGQDLVELAQPA